VSNPVLNIFNTKVPYIYFHTRVIDRETLDLAIATKKSIEIDLSMTYDGQIYIGHPLSFYEYFKKPKPNNLDLKIALEEIKNAGLFLVLDVKNKLLVKEAIEIIKYIGIEKCVLHSYIQELVFSENISDTNIEPHWVEEHLPLSSVMEIKTATDVPLILSCRGIDNKFLSKSNEDEIVEKIVKVAKNNAIAVSLYLHHNEFPPKSITSRLLDKNILTLLNIDVTPIEMRPNIYIGLSDSIENAT
jgi:hypothetical protein